MAFWPKYGLIFKMLFYIISCAYKFGDNLTKMKLMDRTLLLRVSKNCILFIKNLNRTFLMSGLYTEF